MAKIRNLLISAITISSILLPLDNAKADEKIEVIPIIQGTTGLGGKKISYPRWKQAELRFLKVIIPVGVKTPIHTHPAPMVVYLAKGKLKHTRGDVINYFSSNDSFIESNNGDEHIVENIGNKPAVLYVFAASSVGLPITIHN
jgi:quercetin dioxygenase-like cupin family protein